MIFATAAIWPAGFGRVQPGATSFHVEPARVVGVYTQLRDDYVARVVKPAVEDAWKATAAKYTTSDLVARRSDVQSDFEDNIRRRLRPFGLSLDALLTGGRRARFVADRRHADTAARRATRSDR